MVNWLALTEDQRRHFISELEYTRGLIPNATEKDWWVTLTLKALFQGRYASHIVFKGGTSLSKCWNLISRFSEDIDIALAPEVFGMKYELRPSKRNVKKLKRAGCQFICNELKTDLEVQLVSLGLPSGTVTVIADPVSSVMPDTDPQILRIRYPSLFVPHPYIVNEVKMEVSVRSLQTPCSSVHIRSILGADHHVPAYTEEPFVIHAVEPRKTFLEKVFLLHEEFGKPDRTKIRSERMSRHLYDLSCMIGTTVEREALADDALYQAIVSHRESYQSISWMNYENLQYPTIAFIPPTDMHDAYRKDYDAMRKEMIYENNPVEFDVLIARLEELQNRLRAKVPVPVLMS